MRRYSYALLLISWFTCGCDGTGRLRVLLNLNQPVNVSASAEDAKREISAAIKRKWPSGTTYADVADTLLATRPTVHALREEDPGDRNDGVSRSYPRECWSVQFGADRIDVLAARISPAAVWWYRIALIFEDGKIRDSRVVWHSFSL